MARPMPLPAPVTSAASRSGIAHDEDWIQFTATLFAVVHRLEHFLCDFVSNFRPDSDDLVVAFAVRDYAVEILLLNRNHILLGLINQTLLRRRCYKIVNADRDSGASRSL
jgi:hypothetical protein